MKRNDQEPNKRTQGKGQRVNKTANFFAQANFGAVIRIRKQSDVDAWKNSVGYHNLYSYISNASTEIQGIRQSDDYPVSDTISRLLAIFDKLETLVNAHPPILSSAPPKRSQAINRERCGNVAFRNWSRVMLRDIYPLLEYAVADKTCVYINELGQYLSESFGNSTRMTYGTGHELSFLFFLCSLFHARILDVDDLAASVILLFDRYLRFVRRLQTLYNLAPAGKHGAYSMDDFQFVPFIWGCAQLSYNAPFVPNRMLDADVISQYKSDYMLIGCVAHTADTKVGTFAMHSSQLWSIASLSCWRELYGGLLDMYDRVVLRQFDLMKTARFGQLISFDEVRPGTKLEQAQLGVMSPLRQKQLEDDEEEEDDSERMSPIRKEKFKEMSATPKKEKVNRKSISSPHSAVSSGDESSSLSGICMYLKNITDTETCPFENPLEGLYGRPSVKQFEGQVPDASLKFHTTVVETSEVGSEN